MVIEACQCDEGFGVPHSHVPARPESEQMHLRACRYSGLSFRQTPAPTLTDCICPFETEVKPWVNWRAVAKALMGSDAAYHTSP